MLYRFAEYELDEQLYELRRAGELVELERKVFDVLVYLLQHRDRVVSKDELLDKLWPGLVVTETALTRCIVAARKALGDDINRQAFIKTQHGRGYRFVAPLTAAPPVVSSQHSVVSREEIQTVNGNNGSESRVQSLESEEQGQTVTEQTLDPSLSDARLSDPGHQPLDDSSEQTLDPRRQTLDAAAPAAQRPWLIRWFVLMGLLLLVGVIVAVQYLSLPTPNPQSLTPNTQSLPLPDKPSVVVLPFTNLSGDPGQEYFSDGITEELITTLARFPSLFVIARHSAFTYKGKAVKVQDVGKELGVRYVLEGSVQRAEQWVRVNAQLVDTVTGDHLWVERYDRPFSDIFTLQDEIVQKIVTTLKLQLTLQEQGVIVRKRTNNLEAYDYYLRGIEYYYRLTRDANAQARQMLEKAVGLDPQYAEAYAWLGATYYVEGVWRWSADSQTLERAFELGQKAVTLDDSLPTAHSHLGRVYALQQRYEQAIAEGERAIALDPNNADSYQWQANVLILAGRPEEALKMVKQAMRLNPRYPVGYLHNLGAYNLWTGRYAEAIATLKELISRSPNHLAAHVNLAASYWWQWFSQQSPDAQTLEQAVTVVQRALALNDSYHWNHIVLGWLSLSQKQYEQALAEMERAVALAPTEAWSYAALAEVLSDMGRTEDALEAAAQALRLKCEVADGHLGSVGTAYAVAGRYEEALAPLQRYLSRYPNFLPAHLTLAVVYSELDREAEAQAEAAEVLRLNPKFSLEIHRQRVPTKDPAMLERHIAALRKVGLK